MKSALQHGWSALKHKLVLDCRFCGRTYARTAWRRKCFGNHGLRMEGGWYCRPPCLEGALIQLLESGSAGLRRTVVMPVHRIPLGLLLLSRQQLGAGQLRAALAAQRGAGHGKLGHWLQQLGYASEWQITAALARQWSCPVLQGHTESLGASRLTSIPTLLLKRFQMIPVELAEASQTLLIAFSEAVDYSALYAVEQMLGFRTQACFVSPSTLRRALETLAHVPGSNDVIFERLEGAGECARIIGGYAAKVGAEAVRLACCDGHLWIRLERSRCAAINLVLRISATPILPSGPAALLQDHG